MIVLQMWVLQISEGDPDWREIILRRCSPANFV